MKKPTDRVKRDFAKWAGKLKDKLGVDVGTKVHENKDGSIDAELVVRKVPRGMDAREIFFALGDVVTRRGMRGGWVSSGIRYFTRKDEPVYRKYRGMSQAGQMPQRMTKTNLVESFVIGRDIIKNMTKKKRKKAEQVYFRVHWNRKGKKPTHLR